MSKFGFLAMALLLTSATLANACDGLKSRRASSTQTVQTVTTTTVRTSTVTTSSRRVATAPARVVGLAIRPLAAGCSLLHGCGK